MRSADILKTRWAQSAAIGVGSFVGGAVIGYILGKRNGDVFIVPPEASEDAQLSLFDLETGEFQMETTTIAPMDPVFERLLAEEEEIQNRIQSSTMYPIGVEVVESVELDDEIESRQLDREESEDGPALVNVFTNKDPYWDYELELQSRSRHEPYVISQEEFIGEEMEFKQETITYYQGDDVMADSLDTPIYNHNGLMGELKFGHGSRDPNVVYIRNEALKLEWEVLLHTGHFAHEVMGLEMDNVAENELRHASPMRFRSRD